MNHTSFDNTRLIAALPLAGLAAALRSGRLDLREFTERLCDRIDAVDPRIEALLPEPGRRERMLGEVERLQRGFPDPAARPPLWGVPVGVKDIFHVDGFATQAGSTLPADELAGSQAASVAVLLEAGAIVAGKTVTTEFAFYEPGPTRNPHAPQHTPGGSSSGSAAAVAAGLVALALGTQTVGSTIRPAAYCGIVGFKPSYNRIPQAGVIPFASSVDTVGLFTQDVAGMAIAAAVLCVGWQPRTSTRRPVLGVPEGPYLEQLAPASREVFDTHCALLEQAGYAVRRVALFDDLARISERHVRLISAELASVHAAWFASYSERYRPRTAALIRDGQLVDAAALSDARAGRGALRDELAATMDREAIDLWIAPPAPGPAPHGLDSTGDSALNLPWTHAGLPALSLPAAPDAAGLPLGLQLVARYGADEHLLAWAEELAPLLSG